MTDRDWAQLYNQIIAGDRVALGRAMTLVESERSMDRAAAVDLLERCEHQNHLSGRAIRFAISGAPGVGKSTLIEALGLEAIQRGHKVGVITVDPSSSISRGSILGDKSRMTVLSSSANAFVRSSPAGSILGGMGRRSQELMALLEAAGYDLILVETVGVGQSEHLAWQFTDGFVLVVQPGAGDELQGIKRGITELADIVIVNKADGPMVDLAKLAKSQYQNAMHFFSSLRPGWTQKTVTCSAIEHHGIREVMDVLDAFREIREHSGMAAHQRQVQKEAWLQWTLEITAHTLLFQHPEIRHKLAAAHEAIAEQTVSVFRSAFEIEKTMLDLLNP